jgi:LuxR family transcriptional regulator, maltose regulon positive regulatory protein
MLAKLTRPKVHRALPRERLFKRMDEFRERPLMWVVAPPGSGKTTLVASYIETRKLHSVWYLVDPGDDDIGTFFYYLAQAVPQSRNKRVDPLPLLTPDHLGDLPGFYRHFFRVFFARLTPPALLTLDNYHELPPTSALHGALEHAVSEVPDGINIVTISRSGPPRNMVRLKLGERLATLEWSELRMTLDETRAIAQARAGADERTARKIFQMSDGWAAGIALTVQRANSRPDWAQTEDYEAREDLFEYFATQVLSTAPAETQQFLKRTALLPDMTAQMAGRIGECADGETLLEDLYRRGVFIDRHNTRPPVYHYHDLFRAFLLSQLEQSVSSDEFLRLHSAAATLMEETNQHDHAIRLYLKAGEWLAAKRLILAAAPALVAQGRGSSLRDWISALPRELCEQDSWLDYWFAVAIARLKPTEARPYFERAFHEFLARGNVLAQRMLCAEIILSYMHEFADMAGLDPWLTRLLQLLADPHPFPSATAELHVRTACLFALDFRRPDPTELAACAARVQELLSADVPADLAAMAAGILVMHLYMMADLSACARVVARVKRLQETAQLTPVSEAVGCMQIGHATLRSGDSQEAKRLFELALQVGAQHAIALTALYVYCHLGLAFCALERGDLVETQLHRKKIEEYWVPQRKIDSTAASRVQLWTECRRGHWDTSLALARQHREAARDSGVFMLAFESNVLLAIACAQTNHPEECSEALHRVRSILTGTAYGHFAYEIDLVEAYQAMLRGDLAACHAKLRTGFSLSRRDQGLFLLRMQPLILPRLAAEALAAYIETDYVTDMIRRLKLRPPASAGERWPWPLRIITLGRFEVVRDGKPLEFSRKAPKKTLALLKAIIAHGGRNVREQLLLDTFWSDEEGDVADRSLTAALHRLRALIGDDVVVQQGGKLSLNTQQVWVDVWAFEELAAQADSAEADQLLNLYRGGFLVDDEGEPWSVTARERLRGKFIHLLASVAQRLEAASRFEQAIECYLRGLDADPAIESFYQGLMRCYAKLDRKSEAIAAYQRLKRMLSILLAVKPSPSTEKLYESLR